MSEKTLHSDIVYEGKLINLRRDNTEIGDRIFTREVVEHPGAVAIIPLLNNGKILMIKQYRHPVGEFLFEIPAGTLEKNESAEECAYRELIEETGHKAERLIKMVSCYLAPGYSDELIHIFLASDIEKTKPKLEDDECIEVITFSLKEIKEKIKNGSIKDAKTIAGISYLLLFGSEYRNTT
jgi:ADP-ribose pyrophosphatase